MGLRAASLQDWTMVFKWASQSSSFGMNKPTLHYFKLCSHSPAIEVQGWCQVLWGKEGTGGCCISFMCALLFNSC